jgi:hypothetical protein
MSEFDEQYTGAMPYHASDFQREDYGLDQPGRYTTGEYRETEDQLMGWGVRQDNLPTVWRDPSTGVYHGRPSGRPGEVDMGVYDPSAELQKTLGIMGGTDYDWYKDPDWTPTDVAGGVAQPGAEDSWRDRLYAERAASRAGRGGYSVGYRGPQFERPELDIPEFEYGTKLDLPDYEPPAYDEAYERASREEFIQTYKGDLSETAREAIMGSANVDNPAARGKIIESALEGFGDALKRMALAGTQEGRKAAGEKYGRDINVYNVQFETASAEEMARYDQDLKEDLLNWEMELQELQAGYNIDLQNYMSMPLTARGGGAGKDRMASWAFNRF